MKIAAVTMAYNEPDFLPLWARHYTRQVGARNCYVVDHGSDDASTENLGEINVARIPRSPQDDERRTRFISRFCASLLDWYDWVIYTDIDEIVLADPRFYGTLGEYCAVAGPDVVTAVGFNLHHVPGGEPPLDLARPVTEQRRWVRFSSAMCKPVLTRRTLEWALPWSDLYVPWQRFSDQDMIAMLEAIAGLPHREGVAFDIGIPPLRGWVRTLVEGQNERARERYKLDLTLDADELWEIPARFRGTF